MIERATWKRGLAVLLLVLAAGFFYVVSRVEESPGRSIGDLVFRDQYMPAAGSRLEPATVDPSPAEQESNGDAAGSETSGGEKEPAPAVEEETSALPPIPGRSKAFDVFRIARLQGRSRRIEALETALNERDLSPVSRAELHSELLQLVALDEREKTAEGMLVARGLSDAVVVLGDRGAEVVVPDVLSRDEAGQVGDLIARIGDVALDRITIVDGAE